MAKAEKQIAELNGQVALLAKAVEFLTAPQRKAITAETYLGKSEDTEAPLTDAQVRQKLTTVARTPDLKKSDRDLINSFCLGTIEKKHIEHLLK